MKCVFIKIIFLFTASIAFGQNTFELKSNIGSQSVKVNNASYQIDFTSINIPTHYPNFDTVYFESGPTPDKPIICNFHNDSIYTLTIACCGSLDIIPTSQFKNDSLKIWDFELDFDKIQGQLLDQPYLSIRTKKTPKDSIFAWSAGFSCTPVFNQLRKKPWEMGQPPKCFYWNNVNHIAFFKKDIQFKLVQNEDDIIEEFLNIPGIKMLAVISIRLFHGERFLLTYQEKDNSIELEYD